MALSPFHHLHSYPYSHHHHHHPPSSSTPLLSTNLKTPKPLKLKVSLQETQEPTPTPPFKNSIWVNPTSPNAPLLRRTSSEFRYSRLADLSSALDSSPDPTSLLPSSFPHQPPSHQDAVVVLNHMSNPSAALAAFSFFRSQTHSSSPQNQTILFNVALKALRKSKNWAPVESLLAEMLGNDIKPDNVTLSTVISCARQCNLPEKAVEWFERMPEFGLAPDDVTYSAIIDAYGRAGNVGTALGLYDRARKEKIRLDRVAFATVIRVYAASGNFDGALNVFEEMKALGVKPNVVVFNTLLDAMGRAGRPWQLKMIYKEMGSNGLEPNRVTYSALLRGYCRARYAEDAVRVYKEMKAKGFELNIILYNMLLSMCADVGCVDEAIVVFDEMKGLGGDCKPDSWSYSALITVFSCIGKVSEAEGVLDEMLEAGFQPNIFVFTSLVQCYGKAKRTDDVVRAFDRLVELGIQPDERFCGCLLNVLTQTPKEEVGKVIGCIERAKVELGFLVKLLVDETNAKEVVKLEAGELFGKISTEVRKAYCNCLIDLCVNQNLLDRASVLLELALGLGIYKDLQSKSPEQWSLHVRGLSSGAARTALRTWVSDLSKALEDGEQLPPLLGIHTGHGKHKYSEKGLAIEFEFHLRELGAPFHEAPDKVGWFLTTKIAAQAWLEKMNSPELVAA